MRYRFEDLRPLLDAAAEMQRSAIALMNRPGSSHSDKEVAKEMMRDAAQASCDLRRLIADR